MDLRFTNREKALTQVGGWLYSRGGGGGGGGAGSTKGEGRKGDLKRKTEKCWKFLEFVKICNENEDGIQVTYKIFEKETYCWI